MKMGCGSEVEMRENCVFCNIRIMKGRIIDNSKNTFTILSNPALVNGHLLVIPKRHVEKISELNKNEKEEIFEQLIKMQEIILKKHNGCDIRQNYRPFQKENGIKVNHLHFHLQPREFEDELYKKSQFFERQVFRELSEKELDELAREIFEK
jgi:histidine triad (HIT) family protein